MLPSEELSCPKCNQEFTTSDRLPHAMTVCEHVFCKACLRGMLNDLKITENALKCPRCLKLNKLDPNFKRNLNFFPEAKQITDKLKIIQEERVSPKCREHPEHNANLVCLNCRDPGDPDASFCVSCVNLRHSACPKLLIQPKKDLDATLKKAYVPITAEAIRTQTLGIVDVHLKQIREHFEQLLNEALISFDQDFVRNRQVGVDEYVAHKNHFVVATSAKEVRLQNYVDPFLNVYLDQLDGSLRKSEGVFANLQRNIRGLVRGYTWLDMALSENYEVSNLKHLLIESEKYPKVEELITLEKLNGLRMQFSMMEKQKLREQFTAKGDLPAEGGKYNDVIEQYLLRPGSKNNLDTKANADIMMRETLRNPLNLDPISARITQGCPERLKITIDQGEALSAKAAENFETDPNRSQPLLKGDRFVVMDNWILSRKIDLRFDGNKTYFTRKRGSTSQTLHCLVHMQKVTQESLYRLRLISYDNSCCSHFGFCDVKEIECIKNNKMRFSSKHARCYITNGYAPCILESQQFLGVKWCEEDKNFQQGDVLYIHVVPQRAIHFFLQRQNITISFEKFDDHCDLRMFMTFVNKSNEYEYEQLL